MSLDGKILAKAAERLKNDKNRRENELNELRRKIYAQLPDIAHIDSMLAKSVADAVKAALDRGSDPVSAIDKIAKRNLALQAERAEALVRAGYPMDILDDKPACAKCSDHGFTGSVPCECLMKLYRQEQNKELSALLKLGEETFDSFNLNYYSTVRRDKISPREGMELVYEACFEYAKSFGRHSSNLFLTGAPGLGKTFLSACIAKVVSERGFSVVYDTAISIFSHFEEEKFSRNNVNSQDETVRYMHCDLLIFDDLGTEMSTSFTVSALYDLINTRLANKRQTIISSNLGIADIRRRYGPQIASRLEGEYQKLIFFGEDIRLLKKT